MKRGDGVSDGGHLADRLLLRSRLPLAARRPPPLWPLRLRFLRRLRPRLRPLLPRLVPLELPPLRLPLLPLEALLELELLLELLLLRLPPGPRLRVRRRLEDRRRLRLLLRARLRLPRLTAAPPFDSGAVARCAPAASWRCAPVTWARWATGAAACLSQRLPGGAAAFPEGAGGGAGTGICSRDGADTAADGGKEATSASSLNALLAAALTALLAPRRDFRCDV